MLINLAWILEYNLIWLQIYFPNTGSGTKLHGPSLICSDSFSHSFVNDSVIEENGKGYERQLEW